MQQEASVRLRHEYGYTNDMSTLGHTDEEALEGEVREGSERTTPTILPTDDACASKSRVMLPTSRDALAQHRRLIWLGFLAVLPSRSLHFAFIRSHKRRNAFGLTERCGMPPLNRTGFGLWVPLPLQRIISYHTLWTHLLHQHPHCSMHIGPGGHLLPQIRAPTKAYSHLR
ncbi:hypothetical protein LX36DRAFT_660506 [Colletotrichum falcatum]|nr:hypothetical protein LX36DRAFT_660506 [Colletotrichum falcatum]